MDFDEIILLFFATLIAFLITGFVYLITWQVNWDIVIWEVPKGLITIAMESQYADTFFQSYWPIYLTLWVVLTVIIWVINLYNLNN